MTVSRFDLCSYLEYIFMILFRLHFPLVSVSDEKIYQTFETVFHDISKHLGIIENTLFPLGNVVIISVPGLYYTKLCI